MSASLTADERGVVVRCGTCQKANRIPFARLGATGRCAACKSDLPPPTLPVELESSASFRALVGGSAVPVLVDFWAPWCGPCQMVAPEVAKVAASAGGAFVVAKVNTEVLPEVAGPLSIRSIPTFVMFAGGREVDRTSGALPAGQLRAFAMRAASQKVDG